MKFKQVEVFQWNGGTKVHHKDIIIFPWPDERLIRACLLPLFK